MARRDFITSLFLITLGIGVVAESWRMPRFTEFDNSVWSAPGVVPGMIGLALAAMGLALLVRARSRQTAAPDEGTSGSPAPGAAARAGPTKAGMTNVGIAFALCLVFAVVLVGRVPFQLAAFLFVFAFILIFELREKPELAKSARQLGARAALAMIVALAASVVVSVVFKDIFFVRLP